jgi:hypothetical protein
LAVTMEVETPEAVAIARESLFSSAMQLSPIAVTVLSTYCISIFEVAV